MDKELFIQCSSCGALVPKLPIRHTMYDNGKVVSVYRCRACGHRETVITWWKKESDDK